MSGDHAANLERRDVRMDGVHFFRAGAALDNAAQLAAGNYSYCVAVRAGDLRLRVDFPSTVDIELGPGDMVAVSGLAPHTFIGRLAAAGAPAPLFEVRPLAREAQDAIDLIVGCVPNEPLALGSLTVGPLLVRRGDPAGLSDRLWQAVAMLEAEHRDPVWPDQTLVVRRLAEIMLVNMSRQIVLDRRGGSPDPGPIVSRQILKAMHAVLETPTRAWTLKQLASAAGMSRSRFAEEFKAATGQTPARVVSRLRLTRIARRLCADRLTIEAAAEEAGYGSSAAFVRAFQREFGETPARWRRGTSPPTANRRPPINQRLGSAT